MRTTALQWALGCFLTGAGVLMLVAPHQFTAAGYDALRPVLPWWAGAFCIAGVGLVSAPVFALRRTLQLAAHAAAGIVLCALAFSFGLVGIFGSCVGYAVLGLATLGAGLMERHSSGGTTARRPDALMLAMAVVALL